MDIKAETFMNKTSAYFLSLYYFYRVFCPHQYKNEDVQELLI